MNDRTCNWISARTGRSKATVIAASSDPMTRRVSSSAMISALSRVFSKNFDAREVQRAVGVTET